MFLDVSAMSSRFRGIPEHLKSQEDCNFMKVWKGTLWKDKDIKHYLPVPYSSNAHLKGVILD